MATKLAKLIGDKKLIRKLNQLEKKVVKRIDKKVLRAGAAVYKRVIKKLVPVDEGHAKKSIDYKLTGKSGAVIGARADYRADDDVPANYIHLIEYGHVAPDGTVVPGSHPIERGAAAAHAEAGQKMIDKTKSELNKQI